MNVISLKQRSVSNYLGIRPESLAANSAARSLATYIHRRDDSLDSLHTDDYRNSGHNQVQVRPRTHTGEQICVACKRKAGATPAGSGAIYTCSAAATRRKAVQPLKDTGGHVGPSLQCQL